MYDPNHLSALTYANGFTLWHYKTDDTAAVVERPGYFDAARTMLRTGDFIMINAADGSAQLVCLRNEGRWNGLVHEELPVLVGCVGRWVGIDGALDEAA